MEVKSINFKTNYNGKLDCNFFPHLDLAPSKPINESVAQAKTFRINTLDNSHSPVETKLVDLARFPLRELTEKWTMLSHGMTIDEYMKEVVFAKSYSPDTMLAIYFYQKLGDVA